ncbi:carbohydrate-binding cenc domain protein (plasmid) [Bacillus thuringiensis LM1212]|uniref:carbohydrate binding domain-containing protein n=1 Tax=Bacillus thuringiensis TaxID=1428 RepID=UPI00041F9D53|nr:carbohydrate binding domain-containing protein [Bacillus thuringiensis]AXY11284.1 carbohydrate-binding cenc domain protein [Bacillus thuringiensis LM1212]QDF27187.1 carbohydrate-binding cenc domain protein [Bacillus tropicus]
MVIQKKLWDFILIKMVLSVVIISVLFVIIPEKIVQASGNIYYVSTTGNDSNDGTSINAPFQTIQHAASIASAGDTVYIRGGTYREIVTPVNSGTSGNPITYQSYNDETAIISGNDVVTGWSLDSGNIYKAPINWNLGAGNQVFVDGEMMDEARWPNQNGTLLNPTRSTAQSGSDSTHVVDTTLPGGDNFWNGATIWITSGSSWIAQTSTVTAYDSVNKKLTFGGLYRTGSSYTPKSGNKYYLSGIKAALDTANEWWYDSFDSQLYLWVPGDWNPSSHIVEVKHRSTAIDLSGKYFITINGIQTNAATIVTDSSSNHIILNKIVAKYVSHNKLNTSASEQSNLGLILNGSYNELRNSELAYSSGSLVTVQGSNNNVINSYIHDGGYVPGWEGLVNLKGVNSLISHNTVSDAGRVTVYFNTQMSANQIQYNNIYNAGRLTNDLGMLYGPNVDGQNTEIHHNHVHDNKAPSTNAGIYLDNWTNNFIVHHNVLWNNSGIQLNIPSEYNLIYNNTAYTNTLPVQAWGNAFITDMYGDRLFNNIIKGYDPEVTAYTTHGNEVTNSPGFVDEINHNYHLLTNSPAKDTGIVIPGITDSYVGSAPDIGAYEYGGADWTAGHNFSNSPNPIYSKPSTPHMNLAVNGGFESGNLSNWTKTDAGNAVVVNDDHWGKPENTGMSRSQAYGVKLSGGVDGVAQTITGLQPNTNYVAAGWLRSPLGATAVFGVKNYGGTDVTAASSNSTWKFVKIPFKTGSVNTSATIYFKKRFSIIGEVYVDDAGLILD